MNSRKNVLYVSIFHDNTIFSLRLTLAKPNVLGKIKLEQPSGDCPRLTKGVLKVALSVQYTKSHSPSVVTGIPMAGPFTAAIRGFGNLIIASQKCLKGEWLLKLVIPCSLLH